MTCTECGRETTSQSGRCASCGAVLPTGGGEATVLSAGPLVEPDATAHGLPAPTLDADSTNFGTEGAHLDLPAPPELDVTRPGRAVPPLDADVTRIGAPSPVDPHVTRIGKPAPPLDADVTRIGQPAPPLDLDVTRIGSPAPPLDPDVTRIGQPALPVDPDVTRVGRPAAPIDPDATRLGMPTPAAGRDVPRAAGATPPPRTRTGSGTRSGTLPGRGGYGEAASDLVGQPLGYRYQIIELLGAGGMGAVYKAWDEELSVVVALKTVRPEVAADPETARMLERRFKQELLLARKVTHKNIVRVHDMGEVDGIKYITMPFLEGEDLSTILKREGKLPVPRVMKVARSVASGLAAAHEAGVVHRDLKPANIMIDADGEGLIMDFGVARSTGGAKALSAPRPDGKVALSRDAGQTMAGSVVGTVEYMAPEQARGQEVDQRADIYAFGLILYDLLLGRVRASRTDSVISELNLRMKEPPPAPRSEDPTIPEAIDTIITRCIQPDVNARFATTADLVAALNRLDDNGKPLPIMRRLTWRMTAAAIVVFVSFISLTYWFARGPEIPVEHEPVALVIADFQNTTGDPAFDRTLEPMLKLALEGAGFISAYDHSSIARSMGVSPPDVLDEKAAVELAVKQGVGVVVSGSLTRNGNRFDVSVKVAEAVTGQVITEEEDTAAGKDQVLSVVTSLADEVREALGGEKSDTAQRFAMESLSATSLEVVREYAKAMEALSRSQFNDAVAAYHRTLALDPNFGMAYAGLAIVSNNLGRQQDAEKYIKEAMNRVDSMTERERFRSRGLYFLITNDYQACVKEYGDLIAKYSADASARNNRALCLSKLRDMTTAVEEMRQVVKILPNRGLYRVNLATYAAYGGDGPTAEQEARNAQDQSPWAPQALAFAQLLQGQLPQAAESYRQLGKSEEVGPSFTASGLGDLALYQGRFAEAVRIYTEGAAADTADEEPDRAANKLAAAAYAEVLRGRKPAAIAAAEKALALSEVRTIRFLAARVLVEAGAPEKAKRIAISLGNDLQPESQAFASIIDGMIALADGDRRNAVRFLNEANTQLDTWIGHFELGRAYLAASAFPQADSEFERCISRRGEALALFLDEEPTFGFFPSVYYYQGRVREGLKSARAAESYRAYLDIRGTSTDDPLVPELRKLVGAQ